MRDTPLEASIAQALDDAHRDDSIVTSDAVEFTGLNLGASEE